MNTLFLVALIVEALFGLGLTLVPDAMMGSFGVTLDPAATTFARLFGSALISFPFLLWFARKSDKLEFKKGAAYSLFAYYLVSTVLFVTAQLAGQMNALGWGVIGLHLVFIVWFGYFLIK